MIVLLETGGEMLSGLAFLNNTKYISYYMNAIMETPFQMAKMIRSP